MTYTASLSPASSESFMDFNDAKPQNTYDPIPKGTIARVIMGIKPGGYYDIDRGWNDGYATRNANSGSVYLNCEYTVMDGAYAGRKVWSLIGLHSPKGEQWFQIGRSLIRGILNSAHGFTEKDDSDAAMAARQIKSFAELNGLEFVARIEGERDKRTGVEYNVIRTAITKDHKDYAGHESGYYAGTYTRTGAVAALPPPASASTPTPLTSPPPAWAR